MHYNIFIVVVHEGRTWPHNLKTHLALDPISGNQQLVLQWNTTMGIFKSTVEIPYGLSKLNDTHY